MNRSPSFVLRTLPGCGSPCSSCSAAPRSPIARLRLRNVVLRSSRSASPFDLGVPPKGTKDPELVLWSARHNFCFVTKDQQFGDAGAVPSKHAGVVILVCEADAEVERIEFLGRAVKRQRGQVHDLRFALGLGRMAYLAKDGSVDTLPDGTPWIFDI
jgi:predicted nuclease of predicted toxin-antitoxin system